MPAHALHIVGGRVRERLAVSVGQFPDDPARHPGNENAGRQVGPWQDDGSGGDQRASPDTGAPEHYRANADERAGLDVRAVHTARQFADSANTEIVPRWTRFDIGGRYAFDVSAHEVALRAGVDNVTSRNYWASAGGYPGQGYLTVGAPRTLLASATFAY